MAMGKILPAATSFRFRLQRNENLSSIDVVNGVAAIHVPEDIFDDADLLWKSYVVGYFIGDAPHVGSIHATVNRIWASPKSGSKIDVQFIEKSMVLFRIENSHTRTRVIQRRYWHISDVPLVVSEWSPESALKPPDLTDMPLWIDLKGVPNDIFSHKDLKCLTRAAGKFVKLHLHPNTERYIRFDVAHVLAEVNLHTPFVERITFKSKNGDQREIEVSYPCLPARCAVCQGWGHKGSDCKADNVKILKRGVEDANNVGLEVVPSVSVEQSALGGNAVTDLLKELSALPVNPLMQSEVRLEMVSKEDGVAGFIETSPRIQISEPTTETFPAAGEGNWSLVYGKQHVPSSGRPEVQKDDDVTLVVSPSRFSPLLDSEQEDEELEKKYDDDINHELKGEDKILP
ncbi:unnamed protein product [Brassica napus]|uniref:(rape) hypothetical protein n=1 Tax=Brassica napus TaxID=3708 RepID=A0A816KE76_BRANA|nr:unnamed protein product [Brassica napus]